MSPESSVERLKRLFGYDDWANRETLAGLEAIEAPPAKSIRLLAHIAGAERLWYTRLRRQAKPAAVWPELSLTECRHALEDLANLWRGHLENLDPAAFDETVEYVNSKGEPWSSRVEDILTHVVLHSSYHRGQIAADVRAAGQTPAYTDYIHAVRRGFVP